MASDTSLPSKDRKDCPKEACLRFTVVDYWGDPIALAPVYILEGYGQVTPDTDVKPLSEGYHAFRAEGGEEYTRLNSLPHGRGPYWPKDARFLNQHNECGRYRSPAERKARTEGYHYTNPTGLALWGKSVGKHVLHAGCSNEKTPPCECQKNLVEYTSTDLDYAIVMAFLDNHSGGLHGSGHAGTLIIDGESKQGLFADFGPYRHETNPKKPGKILELAKVRTRAFPGPLLHEDLRLNEIELGNAFKAIDEYHGSGMVSAKRCIRTVLEGPEHPKIPIITVHPLTGLEVEAVGLSAPGFKIHGITAWAAIPLHRGAYRRMKARINELEARMIGLTPQDPNGYSFSYNCMTFALDILHAGLGSDCPPGERRNMDHPNDHIGRYMAQAAEAGFFNRRMAEGRESPFEGSTRIGGKVPGIRHHRIVPCVNGFVDSKSSGPPPAER